MPSYTTVKWDEFGHCAKLFGLQHLTWDVDMDSNVIGLGLFYQDCTFQHLGKTSSSCRKGFELLKDETLDEIYLKWGEPRFRNGRLQQSQLQAIEFRTSTGRMTDFIDDFSEWRAVKLHTDPVHHSLPLLSLA
jgi:hypothetical protein